MPFCRRAGKGRACVRQRQVRCQGKGLTLGRVITYCIVSTMNICFHFGRKENKPLPFPGPALLPGRELGPALRSAVLPGRRLRPIRPHDATARRPQSPASLPPWPSVPTRVHGNLSLVESPQPEARGGPGHAEPRFCSRIQASSVLCRVKR